MAIVGTGVVVARSISVKRDFRRLIRGRGGGEVQVVYIYIYTRGDAYPDGIAEVCGVRSTRGGGVKLKALKPVQKGRKTKEGPI